MPGKLFIVPTPIGNLKDITFRAVDVLKEVDFIACEDTRHSLILFKHYGITTPRRSLHEHNERDRTPTIIKELQSGKNVALISDAGTPLISDPGFILVHCVLEAGLEVESLPGPCAIISALSLSGLATSKFYFLGFLPPRKAARIKQFTELSSFPFTMVFYESTHRIKKFLMDAFEIFGDRQVTLAREMTKKFEEVFRGTLSELMEEGAMRSWKGEFVLILAGAPKAEKSRARNLKKYNKNK